MRTLMIVIAAGSLWAQEAGTRVVEGRLAQELGRFEVTRLVNGPAVKQAPYSAEAITETIQVLGDGNRIETRSSTKIFRDSEGRERREENGQTFISDSAREANVMLNTETKAVQGRTFFFATAARLGNVTAAAPLHVYTSPGTGTPQLVFNAEQHTPVEEDLGTRTIEGVEAQGTRTTVTIPAGEIGNVRPIEIVDERWYSPDLQVIVYSRNSDPRTGTTEYRLINIQRGEQPSTLFEVPADYSVPENMKKGVLRLNVK